MRRDAASSWIGTIKYIWNIKSFLEQGRIHSYPCRVRVGRGCIWSNLIIWTGAVRPKTAKKLNVTDRWTAGPTDRPTDGQSAVWSRVGLFWISNWHQRAVIGTSVLTWRLYALFGLYCQITFMLLWRCYYGVLLLIFLYFVGLDSKK